MPTSQYDFFLKIYIYNFFFLIKTGNCKIFKGPLDIFFIFLNLNYCSKSFSQDCRGSRYFTEANSRKGSK